MLSRTLGRLAVSKAAVESYMEHLQGVDRELPALSDLVPRHCTDSLKDIVEFHSVLCEVMRDNGFEFLGIKVVPPAAVALQTLRATDSVCVPLFSNMMGKSKILAKQQRVQFVQPLFVIRLGQSVPTQLTPGAAAAFCDKFLPGMEFVGSRYPFYPPHTTGFAADLGGCVALRLGEGVKLDRNALDVMGNHSFVMTRENEPIQVGAGKNCLGNPGIAIALATSYAASIGKPLQVGHYIFCSGVSSHSPALPGNYSVNYGVYGSVSCAVE